MNAATVVKPSLEEWAAIYLHRKVWSQGFFVPASVDVDVTPIVERFSGSATPAPFAAILLKAIALMGARNPSVNQMVFNTFYGTRVLKMGKVSVSLPMTFTEDGRTRARIEVIESPHELSLAEIRDRIRKLKVRELSPSSLFRFCADRPNTLLNRLRIKLMVTLLFQFPGLVAKRGGAALALSSLLHLGEEGFQLRATALSPCALSFSVGALYRSNEGRSILPLGICYNHLACRGDEAYAAVKDLWSILTGRGPGGFDDLLR